MDLHLNFSFIHMETLSFRLKLVVVFMMFCTPAMTSAEALYPRPPVVRIEGLNQGQTNRCFGTAVATAYEHAFEARGYPVKLSLLYTQIAHAIYNVSPSIWPVQNMKLTKEDKAFVEQTGYLLPHYLWPEDLSCVDKKKFNLIAPDMTRLAHIPEKIKNEFKFEMTPYQKQASFDLAKIKELLKNGEIITLSIQTDLFQFFNDKTGLIDSNREGEIKILLDQRALHMVALVGFDDELYETGGFIIKNTWDHFAKKKVAVEPLNQDEEKIFQSFRAKIYPTNLSGYYAIPYWLIEHIIEVSKENSQFEPIYIHPAPPYFEFYEKYQQYEKEHPVYWVPFACRSQITDRILGNFKAQFFSDLQLERNRNQLKNRILDLQLQNPETAAFNLAQLSAPEEIFDFYRNDSKYVYFYCPGGEIFPNLDQIQQTPILEAIINLQWNPSELATWARFYTQMSRFVQ